MSPAAQKEAEKIHRKLQKLQDEMDRLQNDVKARKLFEDGEDEMGAMSGEDETDDDEDEEKEGTSESDDEREKKSKGRGANEKRLDFTEVMDMLGEEDWTSCSQG